MRRVPPSHDFLSLLFQAGLMIRPNPTRMSVRPYLDVHDQRFSASEEARHAPYLTPASDHTPHSSFWDGSDPGGRCVIPRRWLISERVWLFKGLRFLTHCLWGRSFDLSSLMAAFLPPTQGHGPGLLRPTKPSPEGKAKPPKTLGPQNQTDPGSNLTQQLVAWRLCQMTKTLQTSCPNLQSGVMLRPSGLPFCPCVEHLLCTV